MRPANPVLEGVSFTMPAGSVTALVGKSGGGKSTIVHLLLRFYDPQEGVILLGGTDYRDVDLSSLHARTGVVSQVRIVPVHVPSSLDNLFETCDRARDGLALQHVG